MGQNNIKSGLPVVEINTGSPATRAVTHKVTSSTTPKVEINTPAHILLQFTNYVVDKMDKLEMDYYRRLAAKQGRPVNFVIAKSLVDFFRIQDAKIDLSTLLKNS